MQPIAASRIVLLGLLLGLDAGAGAQTVYRCGPAGNQYSALPCDGGRQVDVSDSRSAEQIADARDGAAAQRRLALTMSRERSQMERDNPPRRAGSIGPAKKGESREQGGNRARPAKGPAANSVDSNGHFVAIVPGSGKIAKKTKPQR